MDRTSVEVGPSLTGAIVVHGHAEEPAQRKRRRLAHASIMARAQPYGYSDGPLVGLSDHAVALAVGAIDALLELPNHASVDGWT